MLPLYADRAAKLIRERRRREERARRTADAGPILWKRESAAASLTPFPRVLPNGGPRSRSPLPRPRGRPRRPSRVARLPQTTSSLRSRARTSSSEPRRRRRRRRARRRRRLTFFSVAMRRAGRTFCPNPRSFSHFEDVFEGDERSKILLMSFAISCRSSPPCRARCRRLPTQAAGCQSRRRRRRRRRYA